MRKAAAAIIILLFWVTLAGATGSCVFTSMEKIQIDAKTQRIYVTHTCTSDGSGIAAYTFAPSTYGVTKGWYWYNITTDPDGTSAPTDSYDITALVTGEDVAGGLLADRSSTLRQTVSIAPPTLNYYMVDGSIVFTFANITSNPGVFVMTNRFSSN